MALDHVRDLADRDRCSNDGNVREIRRRRNGKNMAHGEPLVRGVDETARAGRGRVQVRQGRSPDGFTCGLDHLIEFDALLVQPHRIHQDLNLAVSLPPDRDIRDTGNADQSRNDRPLRQRRHIGQRNRRRTHADVHNEVRRGDLRKQRRRQRYVRQCTRLRHALVDHLASAQKVRSRLEQHVDYRDAGDRFRIHGLHPRNANQQIGLEWNRD